MLNRRRALMSVASSGPAPCIPAEYQEVEWVGATGTSPIGTGFIPKTQNMRLVTDIMFTVNASRNAFGLNPGTQGMQWDYYWQSGPKAWYHCGGTNTTGQGSCSLNTWYHIDAGKKLYVDGVLKVTKAAADFSNNTGELRLFSGNNGGQTGCRYKVVYIYDDNESLWDTAVPCYRKSDGRIGFYKLDAEEFIFGTAANTNYSKGADVIYDA